jgi:hypothetical protein
MRKLWRGVVRTLFWSYERGSWPYDVMVVVIVLFVLVTPRTWFHDQPQSSALSGTDVQLVSEDPSSETRTYRLDADVLSPEKRTSKPTPELERETHDILGRTVGDLKGRTFQVRRIDPVLAPDGSVTSYDVTIHP